MPNADQVGTTWYFSVAMYEATTQAFLDFNYAACVMGILGRMLQHRNQILFLYLSIS